MSVHVLSIIKTIIFDLLLGITSSRSTQAWQNCRVYGTVGLVTLRIYIHLDCKVFHLLGEKLCQIPFGHDTIWGMTQKLPWHCISMCFHIGRTPATPPTTMTALSAAGGPHCHHYWVPDHSPIPEDEVVWVFQALPL